MKILYNLFWLTFFFIMGVVVGMNYEQDRHLNAVINYDTIVAQQKAIDEINEDLVKLSELCRNSEK